LTGQKKYTGQGMADIVKFVSTYHGGRNARLPRNSRIAYGLEQMNRMFSVCLREQLELS
jgi:hypothetical protein